MTGSHCWTCRTGACSGARSLHGGDRVTGRWVGRHRPEIAQLVGVGAPLPPLRGLRPELDKLRLSLTQTHSLLSGQLDQSTLGRCLSFVHARLKPNQGRQRVIRKHAGRVPGLSEPTPQPLPTLRSQRRVRIDFARCSFEDLSHHRVAIPARRRPVTQSGWGVVSGWPSATVARMHTLESRIPIVDWLDPDAAWSTHSPRPLGPAQG